MKVGDIVVLVSSTQVLLGTRDEKHRVDRVGRTYFYVIEHNEKTNSMRERKFLIEGHRTEIDPTNYIAPLKWLTEDEYRDHLYRRDIFFRLYQSKLVTSHMSPVQWWPLEALTALAVIAESVVKP